MGKSKNFTRETFYSQLLNKFNSIYKIVLAVFSKLNKLQCLEIKYSIKLDTFTG